MEIEKPKCRHAQVIHLLIENHQKGVTMVTAMKDYFHKFQTRLLEIEKQKRLEYPGKDKLKILRTWEDYTDRHGNKTQFRNYKSLASIFYLNNLMKKMNREAVAKKAKPCTKKK